MKFLLRFILAVVFLNAIPSYSQQNRFVYLQTENKQPFYVRLNSIVYSSSSSGYLIIPKLKDGPYEFVIGFPKNEWPQQKVSYTVDKKDAGFILKNFGDKGWGLFNLQSLEVLMATSAGGAKTETTIETDDAFAKTLSEVVNAPDLNRKPVQDPPKPVEPVVKAEIPVVKKEPETEIIKEVPVVVQVEPEPIKEPEIPALSKVDRLMSRTSAEGTDMVFVDRYNGRVDTIRIFIPAGELAVKEVKTPEPEAMEPVKQVEPITEVVTIKEEKKLKDPVKDPEFIEMDLPATGSDSSISEKAPPKPVMIPNSDCRSNASERDFLKLRKKLAGESRADEMISIARKAFKSDCYSVEQIRNLAVLFFDDAGRYNFFDTAYPFVNDTHNFPSLESALTDPYYITRFQAMIRK